MLKCFILSKIAKGILHLFATVDLIDTLEVLRPHLVDDVGAVRFISFVMSLPLEEA